MDGQIENTSENKNQDNNNDVDLLALLDDALEDFDKDLIGNSKVRDNPTKDNNSRPKNKKKQSKPYVSQETIKKLMARYQNCR